MSKPLESVPPDLPPEPIREVEAAYRAFSETMRRCLDLGDLALSVGGERRAVEYAVGALEDLGPELAVLISARRQ